MIHGPLDYLVDAKLASSLVHWWPSSACSLHCYMRWSSH